MKLTVFTSNQPRHTYLVNLLSEIASETYVIQECGTIFPGLVPDYYPASDTMKLYFAQVREAQSKLFEDCSVKGGNIKTRPMLMGDLNKCSLDQLSDCLKSDIYIIFGTSFIKSKLIDFLVEHKAINIHMGISPYYRGNDCNFWALYDDNPHLVGATIHYISKGLDSGPMLYHAVSEHVDDPFVYTMSSVKSAFLSLKKYIQTNAIYNFESEQQDRSKEIRYSKKDDFTDEVVNAFLHTGKKGLVKMDYEKLKEPFILRREEFFV